MITIAETLTKVGANVTRYTTVPDNRVGNVLTTLHTLASMPGLLLKKISTLEEAFAIGGLILIAPDGTAAFWLGTDLARAINNDSFGQLFVPSQSAGSRYNWTLVPTMQSGVYEEHVSNNVAESKILTTVPGGYIRQIGSPVRFEEIHTTGTILVLGVVTSATCGVGRSDGLAVATTLTAMSTNFSAFMDATKSALFDGVPGEVMGIANNVYAGLREELGLLRPTIDACTIWRNGVITPLRLRARRVIYEFTADGTANMGSTASGFRTTNGFRAFPMDTNLDIRTGPAAPPGFWNGYITTNLSDGIAPVKGNVRERTARESIARGLGFRGYALGGTSPLNVWDLSSTLGLSEEITPAHSDTGVIDGFGLGLLRNGHVLHQSLRTTSPVDYAAMPTTWTMAGYVKSFLENAPGSSYSAAQIADADNGPVTLATDRYATANQDIAANITSRGSLAPTLRYLSDEFAKRIKVAALAAA